MHLQLASINMITGTLVSIMLSQSLSGNDNSTVTYFRFSGAGAINAIQYPRIKTWITNHDFPMQLLIGCQ